ncbi:hypothetical protein FA95DRAFT_1603370 [Auriscalpium vulgare]|uniref:Uncharacterized protein n=1 Tax=Auriscalpium vulgare TaxID=40419 RepID=A0ACB8S3A1_9AGAM|nr:hypothetical protein FA95DRAFT_1603370 [Auriscalpium vulgare]
MGCFCCTSTAYDGTDRQKCFDRPFETAAAFYPTPRVLPEIVGIDVKPFAVGYIYFRARAVHDVQDFIKSPVLYLLGRHPPMFVDDINYNESVLNRPANQPAAPLRRGQHIRILSGRYDGDLAIILDTQDSQVESEVVVAVVPRFWTTPEPREDVFDGGDRRDRPKPQLFDSVDRLPNSYDGEPLTWSGREFTFTFRHHTFVHGCFVLRRTVHDVNLFPDPQSVQELQYFDHAFFAIAQPLRSLTQDRLLSNLERGDRVRVVSGELLHTSGFVTMRGGATAHIQADDAVKEVPFERAFQPGDLIEVPFGALRHGIV